jgi:hypothetical protein
LLGDSFLMQHLSISAKIFDELLSTVEVLGVDKTINTLKEAKLNIKPTDDFNIEFIITSVSSLVGVPRDRILVGSERNDDRKIAISLCVYFIRKEFNYTFYEMKPIFNKGVSSLCKYYTMIDNLPKNPKLDIDKKITEYVKRMNIIITEKKKKDGK